MTLSGSVGVQFFEAKYNVSGSEILFSWQHETTKKLTKASFRLSIEISTDVESSYFLDLASTVSSYVYPVPFLCRTYTARIAINNSGVIGPQKEVSIDATPFGVFLIGVPLDI